MKPARPPELKERVIELYRAGATLAAIGRAVSLTRSGVWNILYSTGTRRGRLPRVTKAQLADVVTAYQAGAAASMAAEAGRVSQFTAWNHLKALGLLRPSKFAKRPAVGPAETAAIAAELAGGLTPWEAAHKLGLSLQEVLAVVRRRVDGKRH
jgi:hypothetical protein